MFFEKLISVPFQRPSRLKMLISEILENTPETHVDYEGLKQQEKQYAKQNLEINNIMAAAEV